MYYGEEILNAPLFICFYCVSHFVPVRLLSITPLCVHGCQRRLLAKPPFRITAWPRLGGTAGGHLVQVPVAQGHVQDHVRESYSPAQYQFPTVWGTILNGLPVLPWFCVTVKSFRLKACCTLAFCWVEKGALGVGVEAQGISAQFLSFPIIKWKHCARSISQGKWCRAWGRGI